MASLMDRFGVNSVSCKTLSNYASDQEERRSSRSTCNQEWQIRLINFFSSIISKLGARATTSAMFYEDNYGQPYTKCANCSRHGNSTASNSCNTYWEDTDILSITLFRIGIQNKVLVSNDPRLVGSIPIAGCNRLPSYIILVSHCLYSC